MDPLPSSVFSRRPSFFSKSRHRHKAAVPPTLQLPPAVAGLPAAAADLPAAAAAAAAAPRTPPRAHSRHSISIGSTVALQLRRTRSASLRSAASSHHRAASVSTMHSLSRSPDSVPRPSLPIAADPPPAMAAAVPAPAAASLHAVFQHIHELASKRISTLDYLRKAHEGRIYWFNTLLFSKADLSRLPSSAPRAQSRRATQYLLLGFSLPSILDMHAASPADYLRALNALLAEFEQYQAMHPTDGSAPSLSRARIPHMFKRANLAGKARRSSSATADFPLLTPQPAHASDPASLAAMLEPPPDDLVPGESYVYLQTPALPFDPDFFSTFASLCDVLIDCYTKMLSMLSTPDTLAQAAHGVPSIVGDLFAKADARVRKIILAGMVREFEDTCRAGVRGEVGGVGKVVLGGLM